MISSRASAVGLASGVYQVIRWPFVVSDYLSDRVVGGSLLRVGDAPEHASEKGEFLCRNCSTKAMVRRTRSGRWRVTTPYLWRGWCWRTTTRTYRTREHALRRARAFVMYLGG